MKSGVVLLALISIMSLHGCSSSSADEQKESEQTNQETSFVPEQWVSTRVAAAQKKLSQSEAGQLLWSSIETHGGLESWFSQGPLAFQFDYQPLGAGARRNSFQVVDQWSVRAVHEVADDRTIRYGWDGKNAWSYPDTVDVGVNPRFWSTTPFYFVALPFVLADEGVILEMAGQKEYKGVTYDLIKASYESGVGDAPDDYYVIYLHPESRLMGGLRYIVSYPGFFPNGGHNPEKFMEIIAHQSISGISMPTGYETYWFKEDEPAEHITHIDVKEVSFMPHLTDDYFQMPEGAKVKEGL